MRPRRLLVLLLGLAGLGTVLFRLSGARRKERVELYFEDGSSVAFAADAPEGQRLLALAGEVRRAAA